MASSAPDRDRLADMLWEAEAEPDLGFRRNCEGMADWLIKQGVSLGSEAAKLERLRELHHPVVKLRCGARVTKVVQHSSGSTSERGLVCTKEPHPATEPHKDALCCWRFHEFEEGEPAPEDVWRGKNCSCGHYDCETQAILNEGSGS